MKRKNRIFFDVLYITLIISLICFMIWVIMFLKSNAKECLRNPIQYFEMVNDASCTCMNGEGKFYKFDETLESYIQEDQSLNETLPHL